jgi:hypothetical protein
MQLTKRPENSNLPAVQQGGADHDRPLVLPCPARQCVAGMPTRLNAIQVLR